MQIPQSNDLDNIDDADGAAAHQYALEAGFALFELAPRLTRLVNAVLGSLESALSVRQYQLLERIDQGSDTVSALGRLVTITLPAVSESVDILVRKDLLKRRVNAEDRRETHLSITPLGQAALKEARLLMVSAAQTVVADVPVLRREELALDLGYIIDRVSDELRARRG